MHIPTLLGEITLSISPEIIKMGIEVVASNDVDDSRVAMPRKADATAVGFCTLRI